MSTVGFPLISEAWFLAAAMPVIADLGFPPSRFAGMAVPGKWQNLANVNIKGRDRIGHYLCLEQMKPYETRASFERQSGNLIFFNAPSFRCFSVAPTRSHLTPSASIDMISTVATAMELLLLELGITATCTKNIKIIQNIIFADVRENWQKTMFWTFVPSKYRGF